MRRTVVIVALLAAVAGAAALVLLWWTATPAAGEAELAAALAAAPVGDDRLAIAQPRRAARWLLRHPQALALPALAAPAARPALSRLQPFLRPFAAAARGPLVLWWRGSELAIAARLPAGAARGVAVLAARAGVAYRADGETVVVASDPALLTGERAAAPAAGGGRAAALAEISGRLWRVHARRDSLSARTGEAPELPAVGAVSRAETLDVAALAGTLGLGAANGGAPARVALAAGSGWAAAVPIAVVPPIVRDAFALAAGGGGTPGGELLWKGLLGDVILRNEGDRLLLATGAALLAEVEPRPAGDQGSVAGADAAWAAAELAAALERVPLFSREVAALREAGAFAAGLGRARWRATSAGAAIELTW